MNGNVKFQDAMAQRLQLMADHGMNKEKLEECADILRRISSVAFEKLLLAIGRFGRRRRTMDPRKIERWFWRAPSVVKGKQRKPSHFDSASLRSKKIALTVTSHINLIL